LPEWVGVWCASVSLLLAAIGSYWPMKQGYRGRLAGVRTAACALSAPCPRVETVPGPLTLRCAASLHGRDVKWDGFDTVWFKATGRVTPLMTIPDMLVLAHGGVVTAVVDDRSAREARDRAKEARKSVAVADRAARSAADHEASAVIAARKESRGGDSGVHRPGVSSRCDGAGGGGEGSEYSSARSGRLCKASCLGGGWDCDEAVRCSGSNDSSRRSSSS
jgi:hypothetical protein